MTNVLSDNVTVINGTNNTVTATVAAQSEPTAVAVDPVTNSVYVANLNNNCDSSGACGNSVTVINGATNAVTATLPTDTEPYSVAINPVTGKVYIANIMGDDVTVVDAVSYTHLRPARP